MLVLIPELDFSIKTSRMAKELLNSIFFVNWICLCILFRLLKNTSIQVGAVKVAKQSSTYWQNKLSRRRSYVSAEKETF